jgi:hypothetical protein
MIKKLALMLINFLLLKLVYSTKVNIADCDELWGMTNSMNKKTLYSVKIFSCIVNPNFNDDKVENITNHTDFNNTIEEVNNDTRTSNNTIEEVNNDTRTSNNTSIVNRTVISEYDKIITPSSSISYNLENNTVSPYRSSPSPIKETDNNDNLESLDKIATDEVDYNSPSSSLNINKLNLDNSKTDIGLIIGIIISSSLLIIILCGILKYKKNKLTSNVKPTKSLKSLASKTKPHILNTSHDSSKTDETVSRSPHPPIPNEEPNIENINLPSMKINDIEKTKPVNINSRHILDLESGNITTDE